MTDPAKPKRIQRRRTKGWKMPPGAVYVGRPSKWGNPFKVTDDRDRLQVLIAYRTDALVTHRFVAVTEKEVRDQLRGRDLACWCPLDQPCHADVLLELANRA